MSFENLFKSNDDQECLSNLAMLNIYKEHPIDFQNIIDRLDSVGGRRLLIK